LRKRHSASSACRYPGVVVAAAREGKGAGGDDWPGDQAGAVKGGVGCGWHWHF
jgi:hypothetical protein